MKPILLKYFRKAVFVRVHSGLACDILFIYFTEPECGSDHQQALFPFFSLRRLQKKKKFQWFT